MGDVEGRIHVAVPGEESRGDGVRDAAEDHEAEWSEHQPIAAGIQATGECTGKAGGDETKNAGKQESRIQQEAEGHVELRRLLDKLPIA